MGDGSSDDKEEQSLYAPPKYTWIRPLDAPEPSRKAHTFSRPPVMEALSLLNVAARVGMYISAERFNQREPIFDLNGEDFKCFHYSLVCSFTSLLLFLVHAILDRNRVRTSKSRPLLRCAFGWSWRRKHRQRLSWWLSSMVTSIYTFIYSYTSIYFSPYTRQHERWRLITTFHPTGRYFRESMFTM